LGATKTAVNAATVPGLPADQRLGVSRVLFVTE
jgi:hypothetical protein